MSDVIQKTVFGGVGILISTDLADDASLITTTTDIL